MLENVNPNRFRINFSQNAKGRFQLEFTVETNKLEELPDLLKSTYELSREFAVEQNMKLTDDI